MTNHLQKIALLALVLCASCSEEKTNPLAPNAIIGIWKAERVIDGRIDVPMPQSRPHIVEFTKDTFHTGRLIDGKLTRDSSRNYKLYRDDNPLALDVAQGAGKLSREAFEVDGELLRIVSPKSNDQSVPRAAKIKDPGDDYYTTVFRRIE